MAKICIIDSGVGGISVLQKSIQILPNEEYIYVADNLSSPYGNKTPQKLINNCYKLINYLTQNFDIKIVVFACNTMTAICLDKIKKKFPHIFFVGTYPEIKINEIKSQNTLCLSTLATFKYSRVIKKYKSDNNIIFAPQRSWAKLIDDNLDNLWKIRPKLELDLSKYRKVNFKNVILGCTHYYFIKSQLSSILGDVTFFESSNKVSEQIKSLIKLHKLVNTNSVSKQVEFICTKQDFQLENFLKIYLLKN